MILALINCLIELYIQMIYDRFLSWMFVCLIYKPVLEDLTRSFIPVMSGSSLANGKMQLHSSVKRKLGEEKGYVFDKRLRYNVRQNESNCRFRDIVVRKEEGFTHVLLSSQTTDNNALTPEVRREMDTQLPTLLYCLQIQMTCPLVHCSLCFTGVCCIGV